MDYRAGGRPRLGTAAIGFIFIGAITVALFTMHKVMRYLAAARPMTNSSVILSSVPSSGQES